MKEFYTKLSGVTAKNADGTDRQSFIKTLVKPDMPLILIKEPNNPHDHNAIGVHVKVRAFIFFSAVIQIGYLSASVAEELSEFIAKGGSVTGKVTQITGGIGKEQAAGVNVLLRKIKT